MDQLRRELAPLSEAAWTAIDREAANTLREMLAARKLVDFRGPLGWEASSVDLGRVERLKRAPSDGVEVRMRKVLPLVELRVPFALVRDEIEALDRGAPDADLQPVVEAARRAAWAEDGVVFDGLREAGIRGVAESAPEVLPLGDDYLRYPDAVADALEKLRTAGVAGRDFSIGYLDHDDRQILLYIEETCTFQVNTPEAAVALRYSP